MTVDSHKGMSPDRERSCVRDAKKGDHRAFSDLVRAHQKRIYHLIYRFCPDHDTADELAQETFVKAYENLHTFREEYRFGSWISAIASNLAINYLKHQKRQVSMQDYPIDEIVEDTNPSRNPSSALSDKELREKLKKEVDNLPPEYKAAFVLRMYEDLSYDEIAKRLKIEVGTVMSRLFRARSRLKKALQEFM